mgnify:CR=1 FL=1
MDDDQKDITEEQRLQQAQSSGQSSGVPAGGQSSFSADYSAAQDIQDGGVAEVASEDVPSEQGGLVGDSNEAVSDNPAETSVELSEEDDSASLMNDFAEDEVEEDIEVGEEEVVEETEEPTDGDSEEVVEEEVSSEEDPAQSLPGSVVGPDGQTGVVVDSSAVGADQESASDGSTDSETGDIPVPDLTPEVETASVDEAIDGAFADFHDGDDAGATDVLGGGAND